VVATNLRVGKLEIDIVARDGPVIVVVEVRSRGSSSWTSGFGSIDAKKRARVRRAGERLWQRRYKSDSTVERMRFDAASVTFSSEGTRVEYARAAF
jgi:putative endonuclease